MCVSGLGSEHDMFETGELALNSRSNPFACILVGEVRSSHGMANPGKQGTSSNKFHGSRNPENHQMTNLDRSTAHFCATTQLTHHIHSAPRGARGFVEKLEEGGVPPPSPHPHDFWRQQTHWISHEQTNVCMCRGSLPPLRRFGRTSGPVAAMRNRSCRRLNVHRLSRMLRCVCIRTV